MTAREEKGRWYLNGDKWVARTSGAEAILALARMPSGPSGTQGLGLFWCCATGQKKRRTVVIHRLQENRCALHGDGEVTFEETGRPS